MWSFLLFLQKLKPNGTHEKLSVRVVNDLIDHVKKFHPRQRKNSESPFSFPLLHTQDIRYRHYILRYIHHHHLTQPNYCWCRLQLDRTKWPWNFSLRLLFHRRNNWNFVLGWNYYVHHAHFENRCYLSSSHSGCSYSSGTYQKTDNCWDNMI